MVINEGLTMFDERTTDANLKAGILDSMDKENANKGSMVHRKMACCRLKIIDSIDLQMDMNKGVFCEYCLVVYGFEIEHLIKEGY